MSMNQEPAQGGTLESPLSAPKERSPIDSFVRTWRLVERIAMSVSVLLVASTVGYVSLHALL